MASGELGHAKPIQFQQEVLASLLADLVSVMVPHTRLGACEDKTVAVSRLWGGKSLDIPSIRTISPQDFASETMLASLRQASGLLTFHAWLGTQDLKDEHVMVRPRAGRQEYEIASIDFASAFAWGDPSGGTVEVPGGPPILIANRDPLVIDGALCRIERLDLRRIQETVDLLPDRILQPTDKQRIVSGLNVRKPGIRPKLQQVGWLPARGAMANA